MEAGFVEEPTEEMITLYRSLIGSIGYAAVTVRFDVSYALSMLSRHLSRPNARLIAAAKLIVKYLVHTKDLGITWSISEQDKESGFAKSKLQSIVTHRQLEGEYVAMCDLTCEMRYLR